MIGILLAAAGLFYIYGLTFLWSKPRRFLYLLLFLVAVALFFYLLQFLIHAAALLKQSSEQAMVRPTGGVPGAWDPGDRATGLAGVGEVIPLYVEGGGMDLVDSAILGDGTSGEGAEPLSGEVSSGEGVCLAGGGILGNGTSEGGMGPPSGGNNSGGGDIMGVGDVVLVAAGLLSACGLEIFFWSKPRRLLYLLLFLVVAVLLLYLLRFLLPVLTLLRQSG